jgi:hypothetical protein
MHLVNLKIIAGMNRHRLQKLHSGLRLTARTLQHLQL